MKKLVLIVTLIILATPCVFAVGLDTDYYKRPQEMVIKDGQGNIVQIITYKYEAGQWVAYDKGKRVPEFDRTENYKSSRHYKIYDNQTNRSYNATETNYGTEVRDSSGKTIYTIRKY